jgi:hypothetical protein
LAALLLDVEEACRCLFLDDKDDDDDNNDDNDELIEGSCRPSPWKYDVSRFCCFFPTVILLLLSLLGVTIMTWW